MKRLIHFALYGLMTIGLSRGLLAQNVAVSEHVTADAGAIPNVGSIPFDHIGAVVQKKYSGDGLSVAATPEGVLLRCAFQRMNARATVAGLWITSTTDGAKGVPFRVFAHTVGRTVNTDPVGSIITPGDGKRADKSGECVLLPARGAVEVRDELVRFVRPGLTEEYSVSIDGVRQDFAITERPAGKGELCVEMAVNGARAEQLVNGVQLVLTDGERKIVYNRLRAVDARGKELVAKLEVLAANRLVVVLDDTAATYPVRIDPTFSDANWFSMGGLLGTDGTVYAAVVDGAGNLYIGGDFTIAGNVVANRIAKWDGSVWSALGSGMSGDYGSTPRVSALAVSGNTLYAGGEFTTAGGVPANCVAKWDGNAWSSLGEGMGGDFWNDPDVSALAVSGTDLYAGGWFLTAGGVPANCVAKWDGSVWSSLGEGMGGWVLALAVSGSDVYAGGNFTTAGEVTASRIAKWNGSSWSAVGTGMGGDYWTYPCVSALAVSGTDLYAGGSFLTAGGVLSTNIAKWNGSAWSALGNGISCDWQYSSVSALAVSGTDLYAGGNFYTIANGPAYGFAKWNGSVWSGLERTGGDVNTLAVSGANLYVGGAFSWPVGANIAKWNGGAWSDLGDGMNGSIYALAVSGTDLYAGGGFTITTASGATARFIAKWDGNSWSALGDGMNGNVNALAVSGTNLYAGGGFTVAGGVSARCIAKWDGSAWSALGSGMGWGYYYTAVRALAVLETNLYAGGQFYTAGGVAATNIAKWDGSSWSSLGSGMSGWDSGGGVYALAVLGTNLYAGGRFISPVSWLAKWDGTAWSAVGGGISACVADGYVMALAVSGSNLYVGGTINGAGGASASCIAKWDGSTWSVPGSGMGGGSAGYPTVNALAISGTDLYAGGDFTTAGGVPASCIARWDGSAWAALGSGMNGGVSALAVSGTSLYAGGQFLTAGGKLSPYLARAELTQLIPYINSGPASRTNTLGTAASFTVTATGKMPLSCFWQKNGTYLSDGGNISGTATTNLLISNIQFGDAGSYSVVVSNAYGCVTSAPPSILTVSDFLPPSLNITSHTDFQLLSTSAILLSGTASDAGRGDNGVMSVTVNGIRATNDTASGAGIANWSKAITNLVLGINQIVVVAKDGYTNSATNVIHIISNTAKPTNTITAPTAGLRWSNSVFTVTGTAKDNLAVSNVFYQLNGGNWTNATSTNGWTNWTGSVTLSQGTNTLKAYAMDTGGNLSTTSTVSFVYVPSDILQVRMVGKGILSPNYSNAVLAIGQSYNITSTPASGFVFSNWTGGVFPDLAVLTNKSTLRFVMLSNLTLQANFVDTNKPIVSITNMAAGQRVSNAVFTVKGTASDNWQVSNVVYEINGGGWNLATNINNWTNWAAGVTLIPGTNVVKACAVDTTGNQSTTNSVSFQFVVTNQLQIHAIGLGTISPNYSNAWLEIGRNYSITSKPASGFVFTNWVTSTNWIGGTTTTKTNLPFMMASNLTLQVNFTDVARPTNKITAPTAGQRLTNAVMIVKGTASDNYMVAAVFYQLNTNVWTTAGSTNGWTNWTASVALLAGTNTVKAYAVDTTGNVSTTNSVSFVSPNAFRMCLSCNPTQTLTSNGLGLIFNVSTGLICRIEVSTNLLNWTTLTNFFATNSTINLRDIAATNYQWRFYRAATP